MSRKFSLSGLALLAAVCAGPALAGLQSSPTQDLPVIRVASVGSVPSGTVSVIGVDDGDMLKMRRGPGLGYQVIVGLPKGTVLRNHGCQRVGGTPWCEVSMKEARQLRGYVSGHYLEKK